MGIKFQNLDIEMPGLLFMILTGLAIVIANGAMYTAQVNYIETITEQKEVVKLYEEKSANLMTEFKSLLVEKYPQHEKEIFAKITNQNDLQFYAVKYPEIRTADVFLALVKNINSLTSHIYDVKVKIERNKKYARAAKRNPWIITSWLPTE